MSARYLVAMFESLAFRLPIQVWNEYRNALDHFMRYISYPNSETKLNLRRMEGHIQRAVLDMCKIICFRMNDKLEKQIESDSIPCLRLVEDNFYERLLNDKRDCLRQLAHAKTVDHGLGENVGTNMEIVKNYLVPALGMLALWRRYEDNRLSIEKVAQILLEERRQERRNTIEESSRKWYSTTNLKNHLFPKLIMDNGGSGHCLPMARLLSLSYR
ncbi:hypothetical protein [Candidatus Thiosymbion oneisti]|uniref:hypothetical protein n=2 Tax=Candidatus Thiosymbion oneisti TaxID=589554 RepID=UPI001AADD4FA|nr:hypothetical protein [Candidatus Thiosymbion oneisti]